MASRGYLESIKPGKSFMVGLRFDNDTNVFHAGTKKNSSGEILTNGGRVLSITSLDDTLEGAKKKSYSLVSEIHWGDNEEYYRTDIASKGIEYSNSTIRD